MASAESLAFPDACRRDDRACRHAPADHPVGRCARLALEVARLALEAPLETLLAVCGGLAAFSWWLDLTIPLLAVMTLPLFAAAMAVVALMPGGFPIVPAATTGLVLVLRRVRSLVRLWLLMRDWRSRCVRVAFGLDGLGTGSLPLKGSVIGRSLIGWGRLRF